VNIDYVDEGDDLRGSAGALRLALDAGVLPSRFFVLYGDSYLTVPFGDVEERWRASGLPAIMTVLRNAGRWDASNAILRDGRVFYDKRARVRDPGAACRPMEWIAYGLSATTSEMIADWLQPGARGDLADLFHRLSLDGKLASYEVTDRFYEVGSPGGLRDLEDHLRQRSLPTSAESNP
jgi:NDP-sugar pyrophosphorylase family protein